MEYLRVVKADWKEHHLNFLKSLNIKIYKSGIIHIKSEKEYNSVLNETEDLTFSYNNKARVIFSKEELEASPYYLCLSRGPELSFPVETGEDGRDYVRFAFGEICNTCLLPLGEQCNPINLRSEKKLPKKYLFGTHHWLPRAIITDKERFKLLNKNFGFKSREVLIGHKKQVSKNLLQVIIPVNKVKLSFGDSYFGKSFNPDTPGQLSEELVLCKECGKPKFTNSILDFFPLFDGNDIIEPAVWTQEWFMAFHHLVVSKEFAQFLIEYGMIKMDSQYLIPVKDFAGIY